MGPLHCLSKKQPQQQRGDRGPASWAAFLCGAWGLRTNRRMGTETSPSPQAPAPLRVKVSTQTHGRWRGAGRLEGGRFRAEGLVGRSGKEPSVAGASPGGRGQTRAEWTWEVWTLWEGIEQHPQRRGDT